MRSIVADTTPLNYLILVRAVDVVPRIYGRVLIPPSVYAELSDPQATIAVPRVDGGGAILVAGRKR
jgi:predicted nucleic acid-binding protein